MKEKFSLKDFFKKMGRGLKNAFMRFGAWWKRLFGKLSTRSLILIASSVALALIVLLTVLFIVLKGDKAPDTTTPDDTTDPSVTTTGTPGTSDTSPSRDEEFLVTPTEEIEVAVEGNTITLYVEKGTETVNFASMVTAKKEWTISDGERLIDNKILPVTKDGVDFVVSYDNYQTIYRVIIRYYEYFEITFEGLAGYSQTVRKSGRAVLPPDTPKKSGYRFDGWNFDFDTPVTADRDVAAKWVPNRYQITLDAAGGSVTPGKIEVVFGEVFTLPTPTREGYNFMGWYDGDRPVLSEPWTIPEDRTVTAHWDNCDYRITYDPAGGYVSQTIQGVSYGEPFTPPMPTRTGYTFLGWFVGDKPLDSSAYAYKHDSSCVARWVENQYTVLYITNGGEEIPSETLLFTEIGGAIPTRTGYTFGGWYYDAGLTETAVRVDKDGKVRLYAWWKEEALTSEFDFVLDTKGAVITGYRGARSLCVLPNYIGGLPVVAIGDSAFAGASALQHIVLPKTVTVLGEDAFAGCSSLAKFNPIENSENNRPINLDGFDSIGAGAFRGTAFTAVYLPEAMTKLPAHFFAGCTRLVYVNFGGVTEIGDGAFAGCTSLAEVLLPDPIVGLGEDVFRDCTALESLWLGKISVIGKGAFAGCTSLKAVILPASLSVIEDELFAGCSALASVRLLSRDNGTIVKIGARAFSGCKLEDVKLPKNLSELGEGAFENCTVLTQITLPAGIKAIEKDTFSGCQLLGSLTVEGKLLRIGEFAFRNCYLLSAFTFDEGLVGIGEGAFQNCLKLTEISLPNSVLSLGRDVFSGCMRIEKVTLSAGLIEIAAGAFEGCHSLQTLIWQDSVTAVGAKAFAGCSKLLLFSIPAALSYIGEEAFSGCYGIETLTLGKDLSFVGSAAFANCILLKSVIFQGSAERWKGAVASNAFEGCTSLGGNIEIQSKDADDLTGDLMVNPVTGSLWGIDNTLPLNNQRFAAVLSFRQGSVFWRNLVTLSEEGGALTAGYVWKFTVAGETFTITNAAVYPFADGGYVVLDVQEFVPLYNQLVRYAAALEIYGAAGKLLYSVDLGECAFNYVLPSLTEDPNREERDPLTGFTASNEEGNALDSLFDNDPNTRFFAPARNPIVISFENKVLLTSYSFLTASMQSAYPGAALTGWTLYGGEENEEGEIEWVSLSTVENAGLFESNWTEFNFDVEQGTAYRHYQLVFEGEGPFTLSDIVFYGKSAE